MNELSKVLKSHRLEKCLAQYEMAKEIGISLVSYNHLEKGTLKSLSFIITRKLAKYLNLSPEEVYKLWRA